MTEQPAFLKPQEFAILAWGWTPGEPATLADLKRCGFNLAGFVRADELDAVAAAGLQAIVFDNATHASDAATALDQAEIDAQAAALTARAKGHPALFGYYLRDEPAATVFAGLARWARAFQRADPAALPYLNLCPNYATPQQMGAATYEEYVESYLATVKPPVLSYDHYALMEGGLLRDSYFENLETIRAAALRHSIPFWNIVLSNAHFTYAEPSPAGLRFQAYTTLAYGARGISYFTYFAPNVGNYRLAPIDQFGEKTPTWDMLRNVNMQLHRLGPTYLQLRSLNVFHTPEIPRGCVGMETSRLLETISGGSLVVGEFAGPQEQPYVMVVNKDFQHSIQFTMQWKGGGGMRRVSPYTGETHPTGSEDNWLAPGQGMLLCRA